jgi:predicted MPP superfamily phosphohydrolase
VRDASDARSSDPRTESAPATAVAAPAAPRLTRRQFLGATVAAIPPIAAVAATGRSLSQLDSFRIRSFTIGLPQLPPELDGMTIAQVADVHVGPFTHGPMLRRIVEATNNLRADLVLLTGDLINHSLSDLPAGLDMVKQLDPRSGLAMCEGNHDLFDGREEFDRRVKASGVPLLIDETMTVRVRGRNVQLLGLQWGPRRGGGERVIASSIEKLAAQLRPDAFPILLAHHPHAFDHAPQAGMPLTLAGHTHGGQLMLTPNIGFGPEMFKYWSGLYRKPAAALVVCNGVGNWFPLRINAPAEIVHVTLRRSPAA